MGNTGELGWYNWSGQAKGHVMAASSPPGNGVSTGEPESKPLLSCIPETR